MNIHNVSFEISAVVRKQYPPSGLPEFAFVGRSNVGKSSLINTLLGRKNLARVSSSPGKTATINFYNVDDAIRIVDLPGYGFARVSKAEKERWGVMIDGYLGSRPISKVIQLVDMRHKPSKDDVTMINWVREMGLDPVIIATKYDKLKVAEREPNVELICETLGVSGVIQFSSKTGLGKEDVWKVLQNED